MMIRDAIPGCAAGDFLESQALIELDRARIIIAYMQPDRRSILGTSLVHRAFGERPSNAAATIVGMCCHVRDQIDASAAIAKRDQAGIANDTTILLPDISHHWQRGGFVQVRCPTEETVIVAGAAHIRKIALTVIIHGGREAQLDQDRNRWEIPQ